MGLFQKIFRFLKLSKRIKFDQSGVSGITTTSGWTTSGGSNWSTSGPGSVINFENLQIKYKRFEIDIYSYPYEVIDTVTGKKHVIRAYCEETFENSLLSIISDARQKIIDDLIGQ